MRTLDGQYFGSFRSKAMWPDPELRNQLACEERWGPDRKVIAVIDAELAKRARENAAAATVPAATTARPS